MIISDFWYFNDFNGTPPAMIVAIHIVTARPCQGLQEERAADGVRGRNHHLVCLGVAGLLLHMFVYLMYTDIFTIFYIIY